MQTIRVTPTNFAILTLILLAVLVTFEPSNQHIAQAATQATNFSWEAGVSGQVITNPTVATYLTVPAGATHAWFTIKDKPACWGADATAPTASSGGEWPAGAMFKLDNDRVELQSIRIINCSEGATTVKIYYTKKRVS